MQQSRFEASLLAAEVSAPLLQRWAHGQQLAAQLLSSLVPSLQLGRPGLVLLVSSRREPKKHGRPGTLVQG